jgi:CelD/BcsL family acetyltransferase involved in cellulose biosynthesis
MTCVIKELSDIEEFLALEREWNELLAESHCDIPFLRHEWLKIWWRHFGPPNRLAVMVGREQERLVFALPLMEVREAYAGIPVTVLQSLTNDHSFRFNFIVRQGAESSIEDFFRYLHQRSRRWHVLALKEIPTDGPIPTLAVDVAKRLGYSVGIWQASEVPRLATNGQWDAYLEARSRHFVKKLDRNARRLSKAQGGFSLELNSEDGWDPAAFAEALEMESRGWKGAGGTAIASNPVLTSFYTMWAQTAAELGWARLAFLRTAGARVAFEYDLQYAARWYSMKASYHPGFRQYSPGQLLTREVLKHCFENGAHEYDFLGPAEEYKARWTTQTRKHVWLYTYNHHLRSKAHNFLKFWVGPRLKRWAKRAAQPQAPAGSVGDPGR